MCDTAASLLALLRCKSLCFIVEVTCVALFKTSLLLLALDLRNKQEDKNTCFQTHSSVTHIAHWNDLKWKSQHKDIVMVLDINHWALISHLISLWTVLLIHFLADVHNDWLSLGEAQHYVLYFSIVWKIHPSLYPSLARIFLCVCVGFI